MHQTLQFCTEILSVGALELISLVKYYNYNCNITNKVSLFALAADQFVTA